MDVVADRSRESRSEVVFTRARGRDVVFSAAVARIGAADAEPGRVEVVNPLAQPSDQPTH